MDSMTIKLLKSNIKSKLSTLMMKLKFIETLQVINYANSDSKTIIKPLSYKGRNTQKNIQVGNLLLNKSTPEPNYGF